MGMRPRVSMKEKIITVGLVAVGFIIAASLRYNKEQSKSDGKKPPVKYRIVKGGRKDSGISMEVVVGPETTREQALELGYFLKEKYQADYGHVDIGIFDDVRCAVGRFNPSIPRERFFRHYLVQVSLDTGSGLDRVEWVKK